MTAAPSGGAVTESRWLIQTVCSGGRSWKSSESRRLELGLAELRRSGALDGASEIARHQLHPVTDPERRHAELEDPRIELRGSLAVHGSRAAGEHERSGIPPCDLVCGQPVPDELRVDARLAHAPCDQLAVLAAEVDDENRPLLRRRLRRGKRDDFAHQLRR